jgi:hypothetical protein
MPDLVRKYNHNAIPNFAGFCRKLARYGVPIGAAVFPLRGDHQRTVAEGIEEGSSAVLDLMVSKSGSER